MNLSHPDAGGSGISEVVTNSKAGLWNECRYYEGNTFGSMTIGRSDGKPAFQPEFVLPTADFVTFRAKQFVKGVRQWDRGAMLRRMHPRVM